MNSDSDCSLCGTSPSINEAAKEICLLTNQGKNTNTLAVQNDVDISKYSSLLKSSVSKLSTKKIKILAAKHIEKFLSKALDNKFLKIKINYFQNSSCIKYDYRLF